MPSIKADDPGVTAVKLSKTYTGVADDTPFDILLLREPRAKDFIATGLPCVLVPNGDAFEVRMHPNEMTAFLCSLSERLPGDIQKLTPADWMAAAYAVAPFFIPGSVTA